MSLTQNFTIAQPGFERKPIIASTLKPFKPSRRHNFASSDIKRYQIVSQAPFRYEDFNLDPSCADLNFSGSFLVGKGSAYESQFENFLKCLNSDRLHGDLIAELDFLRKTPAEKDPESSLFSFVLGLTSKLTKGIESLDSDFNGFPLFGSSMARVFENES